MSGSPDPHVRALQEAMVTLARMLQTAESGRTRAAVNQRKDRARRRITRAAELRAAGLSATMIGIRMARDEQRPDDRPYSERQVRRWLAEAKKG